MCSDPDPALVAEAFRQVQHEAHCSSLARGWWAGKTAQSHGAEKIALAHSELSEALEAMRHGVWTGDHGVDSELADAVIRILDLAGAAHLDLASALLAKMRKNRQCTSTKEF